MQQFLSKATIKARPTKALIATVMALLVCSTLFLTRARTAEAQVDNGLTVANTKFSFKLYDQILKQRSNTNTFISPASVMLALAMTYNGADGTTRDGMARALELEGMSLDDVNRSFADLKSALASTDPKIKLHIANSLWARNGLALNPTFVERRSAVLLRHSRQSNRRHPLHGLGYKPRIGAKVQRGFAPKVRRRAWIGSVPPVVAGG